MSLLVPGSAGATVDSGAATRPLKLVHPPHGGYTVKIPDSWRFVDASYPSDHSTHIWYEPTNPLRRLIVSQDACVGCVAGITDFRKLSERKIKTYLPSALRIWIDGPYRMRFLSYAADPWNNVYPDNGLLVVQPPGYQVLTSRVHLWLPQKERSLALRMLATFTAATTASEGVKPGPQTQPSDATIDCGYWNGLKWTTSPQIGYGYHLTTRNVACSFARAFSRRYKGTDTYYPTWTCREVNNYESFDIRCVSGRRVIRWVGGD